MSILDAIQKIEGVQTDYIARQQIVRGKIGTRGGIISTSRTNYCWVRLFGGSSHYQVNQVVAAFNIMTGWSHNLDVMVQVSPERVGGTAPYIVLGTLGAVGTSMDAILTSKERAEEIVGNHAAAHEWHQLNIGKDALNVFDRAIVELRVGEDPNGASMQLYVQPGDYTYLGTKKVFLGGLTATFVLPAAGTRFDLVYLDPIKNTVGVAPGIASNDITIDVVEPTVDTPKMALAAVLVGKGTTVLQERNIQDRRCFLSLNTPATEFIVDNYGDTLVDEDCQIIYV